MAQGGGLGGVPGAHRHPAGLGPEQRRGHRAGRAPGPQKGDGAVGHGVALLLQRGDEAVPVGAEAPELPVPQADGVHRAGALRALVPPVHQLVKGLLVGHGGVEAGELPGPDPLQKGGQLTGGDVLGGVAARAAEGRQHGGLDLRGEGVGHRVADDAQPGGVGGLIQEMIHGPEVAVEAQPVDLAHAGGGGDGNGPEGLPLVDVADVDLVGGDVHRLQRVQNGVAVVGVRAGVDDDGVVHAVGGVDLVDDGPLVIGLIAAGGGAVLLRVPLDEGAQVGVAGLAVDARLPLAQQVQVGAVDDEKVHVQFSSRGKMSRIIRAAASALSAPRMT